MKNMKLMMTFLMIFSMMTISTFAEIKGEAVIITLLNQEPDPANGGDLLELRFGIENLGDEHAENYILEISPTYPFEKVSGEELIVDLGTLSTNVAGDNMKIVKVTVKVNKDVTAGSYNLPVYAYKEGRKDSTAKRLFNIDIESSESAEIIYIDQVELIPGKITPLTFTINNVGSNPLRDLTFQWENEDDIILPVGSDNTKYIKYIDVGSSAELKFDVIASASADPDLYKLDLTLYYEDASGEETEVNTKAGIYVGGATDFDVAYSESSNGEYTFSISNIGIVAASSVTIRIPDQQEWNVVGTNSVIIGNLNEGDYTIASFTLQQSSRNIKEQGEAKKPAETSSTVDIDIVYTDSRGNRNTITKNVDVASTMTAENRETMNSNFNGMKRSQQQSLTQKLWNSFKRIILGVFVLFLFLKINKQYKKGRIKDSKYSRTKAIKDIIRKIRK